MGIFDKSNYIALTLVLLNKSFNVLPNDIFGEDDYTVDIRWQCGSQLVKKNRSYRLLRRHHQQDVHVQHACDQYV